MAPLKLSMPFSAVPRDCKVAVILSLLLLGTGCDTRPKVSGEAFLVLKSGEIVILADTPVFGFDAETLPKLKEELAKIRQLEQDAFKAIAAPIDEEQIGLRLKELDAAVAAARESHAAAQSLNEVEVAQVQGEARIAAEAAVEKLRMTRRDSIKAATLERNRLRDELKRWQTLASIIEPSIGPIRMRAEDVRQEFKQANAKHDAALTTFEQTAIDAARMFSIDRQRSALGSPFGYDGRTEGPKTTREFLLQFFVPLTEAHWLVGATVGVDVYPEGLDISRDIYQGRLLFVGDDFRKGYKVSYYSKDRRLRPAQTAAISKYLESYHSAWLWHQRARQRLSDLADRLNEETNILAGGLSAGEGGKVSVSDFQYYLATQSPEGALTSADLRLTRLADEPLPSVNMDSLTKDVNLRKQLLLDRKKATAAEKLAESKAARSRGAEVQKEIIRNERQQLWDRTRREAHLETLRTLGRIASYQTRVKVSGEARFTRWVDAVVIVHLSAIETRSHSLWVIAPDTNGEFAAANSTITCSNSDFEALTLDSAIDTALEGLILARRKP